MALVREVKDIKIKHEVEWRLPNFSSLTDVSYSSSMFSICKDSWCLRIYPNGVRGDCIGYIGLFLQKKSSGPPINVKLSLGLKTRSGPKYKYGEYKFKVAGEAYGSCKFLQRSTLFKYKANWLPADVITIFCSLNYPTYNELPVVEDLNEKCSQCGKIGEAYNLTLHQKKDKPVKCVDCSAVLTLQNWNCGHECQVENIERTALCKDNLPEFSQILDDFKKLFLNQEECDAVIKIKGKEFSVHKAVLIARSSVFESTVRNYMQEKRSVAIIIDDCDPTSFSDLLCFLYCGDSGNVCDENVVSLFVTANRYDVTDLRAKCIEFIKSNLSVDTFCDAITLALRYSETELIELASDFFGKNLQKIIVTVKWQSFLAENPRWSNDLFMKALVTDKNSDS